MYVEKELSFRWGALMGENDCGGPVTAAHAHDVTSRGWLQLISMGS
jgi:hypothetical protein